MKKITQKRIRAMHDLLKRKDAHFFEDENKVMYYTYPKDGWVYPAKINGKPVEYVPEHDDTPNADPPFAQITNPSSFKRPVMGKIGGLNG